MTALEKQAGVTRMCSLRYLNVPKLVEVATALPPFSDYTDALAAAGITDLTSIGGVVGFGTKGIVDRGFLNFKEGPSGVFTLLGGKPLTAADLKPVPGDAAGAIAWRLSLAEVYKTALEITAKADPEEAENFSSKAAGMLQALGLRLDDVLGAFGDVWTAHLPGAGGLNPVGGGILTVTVKNKEVLGKVQTLIVEMAKMPAAQAEFSISESKIGDVKAYRIVPVKSGNPSPAWAIADDRLIVAGSLDALKTHITRAGSKAGLAEVPAVASRLEKGPVLLTYQDTKSALSQALAMLQGFGPLGIGMLAQQGINIEMPDMPDFQEIAAHVLPRTSTLRAGKHVLISEAYETVPVVGRAPSLVPVAATAAFMSLTGYNAAQRPVGGPDAIVVQPGQFQPAPFQPLQRPAPPPKAVPDDSDK